MTEAKDRVILHSDLNSFYASVECRDDPQIADKPVAVTGDAELRHGIILTKNQIAKEYGVKTGETIFEAKKKCPALITVKANFNKYIEVSEQVRRIYYDYTDYIEPFGLDECWLDVTASLKMFGGAENIAEQIRRRIKEEVGVTVSIGVSFNKIFAKLGSDMKKPDAVTYITRENFKQKVWPLPAADLLYVGRATERKLEKYNVKTIGKLAELSDKFLYGHLGKHGLVLGKFARGEDDAPVMKYGETTAIKSVGNGNTAAHDLKTLTEVKSLIFCMAESVASRLRKHGLIANGVVITVKTDDLAYYTVQKKTNFPTASAATIGKAAVELFCESFGWSKNVRAITVCATYLESKDIVQLNFSGDYERERKLCSLEQTVDRIRRKYSHPAILRGIVFTDCKTAEMNPEKDNIIHPVSYFKGGKII